MKRLQWNISGEKESPKSSFVPVEQSPKGDYVVTINPMEIRTFLVRLQATKK